MNYLKKPKIAIVIGTKAELIKCMPIMLELQEREENFWFIHTGQHPLGEACEVFCVKKPDFILSKEPDISTKFWSLINQNSFTWNILMTLKIRKLIRKLRPKYVIYHGDTMSTADAAIGTSKIFNLFSKTWHNVHLEAGLRSGSLLEPFPEEISRQISDRFSDILLAVSDLTEENLKKERTKGIFGRIRKVGNTIVDSSIIAYNMSEKNREKEEYALINIHRHENLNSKARMKNIVEILKNVKIKAIWPIHDNTKYFLKKYNLFIEIVKMRNIEIIPLADYSTFISLLANSKYLITDGGSIQEESLVFKIPCILLRKRTERQEGLSTGINFLTGLNIAKARRIIKDIEGNKLKIKDFKNPYGEPGVSKKIVDLLI
jgi:UDP-N-acetylglucosamine 2-epimerase (non-hydrolysing)